MASTPIVKKPKDPVAFPPANYLRAFRVREGDNWWTLQKKFNLRDPWTLIRYNFSTEDPAEVNWYLREYLGCTKTTADHKNYCFSNEANPGKLYLPRRNFKYGLGGGGGGTTSSVTPEQQAKNDAAARSAVTSVLGLNNALGAVDFNVNGFQITSHDYDRVRRLIRENQIYVAYDGALGHNARYDAGADTLYYGQTEAADVYDGAMVIHEATHAAFDAMAKDIHDAVSETIAYIAQMVFIMARDRNAQVPGGEKLEAAIFRPAWRYAKRLRDRQLGLAKEDVRKDGEDILELQRALIAHPIYQKQFSESDLNYDGLAGFDGIKGWSYHWVE